MFGQRFWGNRMYGGRYWGHVGADSVTIDPSRYTQLRCAQNHTAELLGTEGQIVDLRGAVNLNAKLRGKI